MRTSVVGVTVGVLTMVVGVPGMLIGCRAGAHPGTVEISVFAAASLREVLIEASDIYEAANPGVTLSVATDSSTALRTQIEHGAPADVFLSADTANAGALADAGLATDRPVAFARNVLVVVVPRDNPAYITTPADLARPGVQVIATGESVPIGRYASRLVAMLARLPGYPRHFAEGYAANVVSREDNVSAVVAKVALGEGDAAIVYRTDARSASGLMTVAVPRDASVSAEYAGVVMRSSHDHVAARSFLDWLAGPQAGAVLARHGFELPDAAHE